MSGRMDNLVHGGMPFHNANRLFWLDTLCVPRTDMRAKAINSMELVYARPTASWCWIKNFKILT